MFISTQMQNLHTLQHLYIITIKFCRTFSSFCFILLRPPTQPAWVRTTWHLAYRLPHRWLAWLASCFTLPSSLTGSSNTPLSIQELTIPLNRVQIPSPVMRNHLSPKQPHLFTYSPIKHKYMLSMTASLSVCPCGTLSLVQVPHHQKQWVHWPKIPSLPTQNPPSLFLFTPVGERPCYRKSDKNWTFCLYFYLLFFNPHTGHTSH